MSRGGLIPAHGTGHGARCRHGIGHQFRYDQLDIVAEFV